MKVKLLVLFILAATVAGEQQQQQQQCSSDSGVFFGPKVHFPDDGSHNDNVREVLMAMGFAPTDTAAGAQAQQVVHQGTLSTWHGAVLLKPTASCTEAASYILTLRSNAVVNHTIVHVLLSDDLAEF